ncbi:MAG: hypothetical protein DMG07_14160 [Acidobacteria bacterium]|nr:MAG: hypothetical protein DMG07_14160 [Acidobacteriota bacterium]
MAVASARNRRPELGPDLRPRPLRQRDRAAPGRGVCLQQGRARFVTGPRAAESGGSSMSRTWLSILALAALGAATRGGDALVIGDRGYADFIQGEFGNSGANLYVSKAGRLGSINRWDFNNDGQIDLLVNNKHDYNWAPDALIYWGKPDGFQSLTPTGWQKQPLFHLISYLEEARSSVTRLPAFGGGRSRVVDLNRDGYLDLLFINFLHAEKTQMEAYLYWGSAAGFDVGHRTELPTLLATGLDAADCNGDGYVDLVFSNFGVELGERFGYKDNLESWIYWGSSTGYDVRRRSSVPTISAVDCAVGDFNGDGRPDLVFLNNNSKVKNAYIYWGNGRDFSPERRTTLECDNPKSVTAADLDGDGHTDLVITSAGEGTSVFYGTAQGIEAKPRVRLASSGANAALVFDLNRDGRLDLALANTRGASSVVYWGSAGGFGGATRTELPTLQAWGVAAGDLNGDGWPELVFANSSDGHTNDVNSYVYWGSPSGSRTSTGTAAMTWSSSIRAAGARTSRSTRTSSGATRSTTTRPPR